jgi:hypothetical protein
LSCSWFFFHVDEGGGGWGTSFVSGADEVAVGSCVV